MVRFLDVRFKNALVISISGGKIIDCYNTLISVLKQTNTFVVIFHGGTNNVNKTYYPADTQLKTAICDLEQIMQSTIQLKNNSGLLQCFLVVFIPKY